MKLDIKSIVIIVLAIWIGCNFLQTPEELIDDVIVSIPATVGKVEKEISVVIPDTIYIKTYLPGKPLPSVKEIIVDSLYKKKYEDAVLANDSLKLRDMFLESIALDTYSGTLIDDEDITIKGEFQTRGKLFTNRKGHTFTIGYSSDQRVMIGYQKTFKLF